MLGPAVMEDVLKQRIAADLEGRAVEIGTPSDRGVLRRDREPDRSRTRVEGARQGDLPEDLAVEAEVPFPHRNGEEIGRRHAAGIDPFRESLEVDRSGAPPLAAIAPAPGSAPELGSAGGLA